MVWTFLLLLTASLVLLLPNPCNQSADIVCYLEGFGRTLFYRSVIFWIASNSISGNVLDHSILFFPLSIVLASQSEGDDNNSSQKKQQIFEFGNIKRHPIGITSLHIALHFHTGKSFSEAFIFASTNPKYDKNCFIDLQVQYMKIPCSEHVKNMFCT